MSLLAAVLFFTAAHAQSGKVYEGELSIGGLVYRDNSFAMIETVHGRRFSPTFFLGGGVRTTYHGQQITSEEVQRKLNTAGLAAFADVKLYITPDRRFCPYLNLQGGVQGMMARRRPQPRLRAPDGRRRHRMRPPACGLRRICGG